jgi:hypothetical protein
MSWGFFDTLRLVRLILCENGEIYPQTVHKKYTTFITLAPRSVKNKKKSQRATVWQLIVTSPLTMMHFGSNMKGLLFLKNLECYFFFFLFFFFFFFLVVVVELIS